MKTLLVVFLLFWSSISYGMECFELQKIIAEGDIVTINRVVQATKLGGCDYASGALHCLTCTVGGRRTTISVGYTPTGNIVFSGREGCECPRQGIRRSITGKTHY